MWCLTRFLLMGALALPVGAAAQSGGTAPDASHPVANEEAPPDEVPSDEVDTEGARVLFLQGVELMALEDWSRAADRFRTSLSLRHSMAGQYNLASALFQLGQLNEAEQLVLEVRDAEATPADVRAAAQELAERIPFAGGQIIIRVDGPAAGVDVFLDDRRLPGRRLDVSMTMSLGSHAIEARRQSTVVAREEAMVSRDQTARVVLHVGGDAEFVIDDGNEAAQEDDPTVEGSLFGDWRFWAAVGGGVALVAAIVIISVVVSSGPGTEAPIAGNFQPGVLVWD